MQLQSRTFEWQTTTFEAPLPPFCIKSYSTLSQISRHIVLCMLQVTHQSYKGIVPCFGAKRDTIPIYMANERRYEFINKSPMFHLVLHSWLDIFAMWTRDVSLTSPTNHSSDDADTACSSRGLNCSICSEWMGIVQLLREERSKYNNNIHMCIGLPFYVGRD